MFWLFKRTKVNAFIDLQRVWAARAKRARVKPDSGASTACGHVIFSQDTESKIKSVKIQRPDEIFGLIRCHINPEQTAGEKGGDYIKG